MLIHKICPRSSVVATSNPLSNDKDMQAETCLFECGFIESRYAERSKDSQELRRIRYPKYSFRAEPNNESAKKKDPEVWTHQGTKLFRRQPLFDGLEPPILSGGRR